MKKCSACKVLKQETEFSVSRKTLQSRCKLCACDAAKKWYLQNREEVLRKLKAKKRISTAKSIASRNESRLRNRLKTSRRIKDDRKNNPEKYRLRDLKYRISHKEKIRLYRAAFAKNNPDLVSAALHRRRVKRSANLEIYRAKRRAWYAKNLEVNRSTTARRRAIRMGAPVSELESIRRWCQSWMTKRAVRCYWCSGKFKGCDCEQDHVIPLSGGGAHSISNLVVSCFNCNRSKHARPLEKWNATLEQPVLL